jgi:outer membrane receptor protein involved in Fe transport
MAKSVLTTVLLAGTMLATPLSFAAGQPATPDTATTAAPPGPSVRLPSRTTAEEVRVFAATRKTTGGGLIKKQTVAKSVSTISSEYIRTQPAIQNAYQYVQITPGALVSVTDPYGLSEQGSINIHGLGQDELGYVLEGMPLNDIGYYTAYPSQFIDSENIDEVSLAQGTADLDSPVISAAGGLMNISMLDPSVRPGGSVDVAFGSYNTNREFIRLDSGLIGDTGIRTFVSYSHTGSDDWHGPGRVKRTHVDYKAVREWGDGNRMTLTGTYHDGITPIYVQPTLQQFQQYGVNNNYDNPYVPGDPNYWKLHVGTFRILYMSAPSRFTITDNLTLNVTPYWQYGYGNSPYGTTLFETGNYQGTAGPYNIYIPNYGANGGPNLATNGSVVQANYQDLQYRAGFIAKATYTTGPNSVIFGYWYDYSDETDTESYSALSAQGAPGDIWADTNNGLLRLPNGQLLLAGQDHVITQVNELFVADILKLLDDKLTLEAGFKEAMVSRGGTNGVPGPQYRAVINNAEPLPRLAARYQIDQENQVFANVSTNFRTPSEATFFNEYYGGAIYAAANTDLKPEYSISEDVGYRYTGPMFTASASFFNFNFTNRQIATEVGGSLINESINAGGQTTRGMDVEAGTRPWNHISTYISGEYLSSTIDNNLQVGNTYLPTAGKTAIRSPKFQAGLGLTYDDGMFFGNLTVKYAGSQYSTFMDDEKIPSYTTANLAVGYRLPNIGLRARPEFKLNFVNLGGADYLSGVATPTANAKTTTALNGTQISGSPPDYYLAGGFAVLFTATQAF